MVYANLIYGGMETKIHVVWLCSGLDLVWGASPFSLEKFTKPNISFRDFFGEVSQCFS